MERIENGGKLNALGDQAKYLSVEEPHNKGNLEEWQKKID